MQNVSQALMIAGSLIIGCILLATLMYMLRVGGSVNKNYDETQLSHQTQAFNFQYEKYQRDDNTILDIVTLLNLAYSANSENGYDVNNSVIIILKIGNKEYCIPKDYTATGVEAFYNANAGALKRNEVYDNTEHKVISIYNLLDKTIGDLSISGFDTGDKLSKIHLGQYVIYPNKSVGAEGYGLPAIGDSGTTYKYIFDCDDDALKYNHVTGRIKKMEFVCKKNPDWELKSYNPDGGTVHWD